MNCEVCGEKVENSEDLAKHMERMHPIDEEKAEEHPEIPDESEVPEPAQRLGRM